MLMAKTSKKKDSEKKVISSDLVGFKGFLLFFVIVFCIGVAFSFFGLISLLFIEYQNSLIFGLIDAFFFILNIMALIFLFKKSRHVRTIFLTYYSLAILAGIFVIFFSFWTLNYYESVLSLQTQLVYVSSIVMAFIKFIFQIAMIIYFAISKRVKLTFVN
jgi:hypothetical protein